MSTYYGVHTDRMVEYIQAGLRYDSYWKTKMYSLARKMGWIENMPVGLKEVIETKVNKMSSGIMSYTEENFKEGKVRLEKKTYNVMLIGKTFPFGRRERQAWANATR